MAKLNNEIKRILKPGGINIYTVRHTNDGDFQNGNHIGEDLYENDGFIVHYFSEENVNSLLIGFNNFESTPRTNKGTSRFRPGMFSVSTSCSSPS